jgi:hypothetical protein
VAEESKGVIDRSPVYEGPKEEENQETKKRQAAACRLACLDVRGNGPSDLVAYVWYFQRGNLGKPENAPATSLWLRRWPRALDDIYQNTSEASRRTYLLLFYVSWSTINFAVVLDHVVVVVKKDNQTYMMMKY